MFSKCDIEKYRHTKAPSELKRAVLCATQKNPAPRFMFNIKTISAVAACLLVLIVSVVLLRTPTAPITVTVEELAVVNTVSRFQKSVTLVVESEGKIDVKTKENSFYVYDSESNSFEILNSLKNVKNKLEIIWQVSKDNAILEINGQVFEVFYDGDTSSVQIKEIKK